MPLGYTVSSKLNSNASHQGRQYVKGLHLLVCAKFSFAAVKPVVGCLDGSKEEHMLFSLQTSLKTNLLYLAVSSLPSPSNCFPLGLYIILIT